MKSLKFVIPWLCFLLGDQAIIASEGSYQCVISEQMLLNKDGTLKRPPIPYLIGQRFAVDRNTGQIVGPGYEPWQSRDGKITVLAHGNADNSFVVVSVSPAAKTGVHITLLRVNEYTEGKSKPFVVQSGGTVISGVCE